MNKDLLKKKLTIQNVPIGKLKPSEYNPGKMTDKEERDITASIKKFGMIDPIIVNK